VLYAAKVAFFHHKDPCELQYYLCTTVHMDLCSNSKNLAVLAILISRDTYTIPSYETTLVSIPCNSDDKGNG